MIDILKTGAARVGVLAILLGGAIAPAHTATVYTYTGENFWMPAPNDAPTPAGSFDGSMKVTGFFTLANPLASGLASENIFASILDFSFNNGRATINAANVNPSAILWQVSTDASGNLTDWFIQLGRGSTFPAGTQRHGVGLHKFPGGTGGDTALVTECLVALTDSCFQESSDLALSLAPGTWAVSEVETGETPLPAALPLFASGLGAMGLLGWRRKRREAAAVSAA